MAGFRHMVSMERTSEEKAEARMADFSPSIDTPDVPYGLCIALTETELDKLNLDDDVEVGDYIHLFAMGKVTSVTKTDNGNGCKCRVEIALVAMECEDEDLEDEDDEAEEGRRR